ncbi:MAG: 30S ribosomal protein S20 [Christensenellales bacterium]
MPNIKSAKKRVLVSSAKNLQNRMVKSSVKTALKKLDVAEGDKQAHYREAVSAIDKAVLKGVMHKNAANRKKARLAISLSKGQ